MAQRELPDLVAASRALEEWLGPDRIAGGPISQKEPLSIEANMQKIGRRIEEVPDSEDEDDTEAVGTQDSPLSSQESVTVPRSMRQMSLLKLFHPVRNINHTE